MDREERKNAIRCLKMWIEREPQIQTYKTCLEALEQQPCEDVISRQDAIATVCNITDEIDDAEDIGDKIMIALGDLPSVSTEKTGRWKKIKSGDKNFPESIVCSRCGYENSYINEWNFNNEPLSKVFKTSKYCPNCGAKMEAEE